MVVTAKGFVSLPHGQVHFRHGGRGPVLVLLHDSPRSSLLHVPNIEWLGEHCTVIALDTPGHGLSAPLPVGQSGIADYSRALADALTGLGIDRCGVYGFHSGAKIALQFAVDHPDRAALTLLDGLSVPAEPPDEDFLRNYLQDFEPTSDGAHLARQWTRILDYHRYFPWFRPSARTRMPLPLPDDPGLHEFATDLLAAGPHWIRAYEAALRYRAEPALRALRSPTVLLYREGDPLAGSVDRLPQPLPAGCRVERVPVDAAGWRVKVLSFLREARLPASRWTPPRVRLEATAGERQSYVDFIHGQVRVRRRGRSGVPLLLLHEVPGSSDELSALAANLATDRHTVVPDLPGLGESHPLPYPSLGTYVALLADLLESLELPAVDVFARGLATPFAIALAAHRPGQVRRIVLDAVPWVRTRERGALLRHYCPPIEPDRSGAHLLRLWHQLRDAEASWPWFDRSAEAARTRDPDLDAARLQSALVDVMKQLPSYGDAAKAALAAAVREIAPAVKQPVLLLEDEQDVRYRGTRRLQKRLAQARAVHRPSQPEETATVIREFLG